MKLPDIPTPHTFDIHVGGATKLRAKGMLYCSIGNGGITFNAEALSSFNLSGWEPVLYDAMLVAAAVEYCDRKVQRTAFCWARKFNVSVAIHEPERWTSPEVKNTLESTLRFLTGDMWAFTFTKLVPDLDIPASLNFSQRYKHVMAFSEGVDSQSVAGLYPKDDLVKVRVGTSAKDRPKRQPFTAIPFDVKVERAREDSARSRGFKFAVISGLAAYLCKSKSIIVPESGQGALGPVLASLGRVYPDYRNHPSFFRKMEAFLKALLGTEITYSQPRLWATKGQTIAEYVQQDTADVEKLLEARSCWQRRYNVVLDHKQRQCGLCSACLLRRMSFHAAKIDEPSDTYVWQNLSHGTYHAATPANFPATKSMAAFGIAGSQHLEQLARLYQGDAAGILPGHAQEIATATGKTLAEIEKDLTSLLGQHHHEWGEYKKKLGTASFVRAWSGEVS